MTSIAFLLNGTPVRVQDPNPTQTVLEWLRETRGLSGTKEGCNEGDCGACTVLVIDDSGPKALNACLLFLPQIDGKALRTVEGLALAPETPHPVQHALVDHHASQCGFCTPGIAVSLAAAHLQGRSDHDTILAGNLCRCTGYAPILRAARDLSSAPQPDWAETDQALRLPLPSPPSPGGGAVAPPPAPLGSARRRPMNFRAGTSPIPMPR